MLNDEIEKKIKNIKLKKNKDQIWHKKLKEHEIAK